jgi:ATP-binding cassette subfamily B protein
VRSFWVRIAAVLVFGVILLGLSDYSAIRAAAHPNSPSYVMMVSMVVVSNIIGIVGAYVLRRHWYLGALIPILYFSGISTILQTPSFFWLDMKLPLSILATTQIAKRSQKFYADQQRLLGQLNGHVEEMYTGHKIVKAFGKEKDSIKAFDDINEELYRSAWKAQFMSGIIMPMMNFINNIGYVIVSVVGGIFVVKKRIELGDVQAFIQYSRQFSQPIVQTANIANILQSTVASAERVFELLDEPEEIPDGEDAKVIEFPKGEVRFENVKFGYKEDVTLIEDMNIDVRQGETIAIVGPTGAGKTTLVNLLMRFYEIGEGKITVYFAGQPGDQAGIPGCSEQFGYRGRKCGGQRGAVRPV